MTVDLSLLPSSAFVDSGVFMVGMGQWPLDPRRPACEQFLKAMLNTDRPIGISTLTQAEWMRHGKGRDDFPSFPGLEPRGFDYACAKALAEHLHMRALSDMRASSGVQRTAAHWKFDTLIVATAFVWLADDAGGCFVSLDHTQREMAKSAGLRVLEPDDFQAQQTSLVYDDDL